MSSYTIRIDGKPVSQGRPRFYRVGKQVRVVDASAAKAWKKNAKKIMAQDAQNGPLDGGLSVRVGVYMKMPKTRMRDRPVDTVRYHTNRPDIDNIVKAVLDAGNGVLYHDDCQICHLEASKYWLKPGSWDGVPPEGCVEITVEQIPGYENERKAKDEHKKGVLP